MHVNWRIAVAEHAAKRSATAVHQEMARGLYGLATVAATAPFAGILGNLLGIVGSFKGVNGDKASIMAVLAEGLSESIWPTAFGLAVAIVALLGYRYFTARLAGIDAEMEDAIAALPACLLRCGPEKSKVKS